MIEKYQCFDPKVNKPRHLLERKDAREAYNWFIQSIPERVSILKHFAQESGCQILNGSEYLEQLHNLYLAVCLVTKEEGKLSSEALSLASDVGMYMGELAVEECHSLSWKFHTFGKSNVHYHRPVIMGFKNVKNSKYSIDFEFAINSYGNRIIRGQPKEEYLFLKMYNACLEKC